MPTQTVYTFCNLTELAPTATTGLAKFDPTLGTLQEVKITWETQAQVKRRAENISASPWFASWGPSGDHLGIKVSTVGAGAQELTRYIGRDFAPQIVNLAAYDGVTNYAGVSGFTAPPGTYQFWPFASHPGVTLNGQGVRVPNVGNLMIHEIVPSLSYFIDTPGGGNACSMFFEMIVGAVNNAQAAVLVIADQREIVGALKVDYTYI